MPTQTGPLGRLKDKHSLSKGQHLGKRAFTDRSEGPSPTLFDAVGIGFHIVDYFVGYPHLVTSVRGSSRINSLRSLSSGFQDNEHPSRVTASFPQVELALSVCDGHTFKVQGYQEYS